MRSRRARRRAVFVLILGAVLLGGCWGYNEVNDLAFVTVAALDRAPAGGYRWTVAVPVPELVLPASVGGGGAGGPGIHRNSLFRSSPGPAPRIAAESLDVTVPREVRWSFADHILLGEAAARSGLRPLLEMISRGYRVERRASLYVVRGEAGTLLENLQPALDRSMARSFDALGRKNRPGTTRSVDGNTFLRWLDTPGIDPFLPVIAGAKTRDSVNPVPAGIALFDRDRLAGFLPPPLDTGLLMARGEAHPFYTAVPCPGTTVAAATGGGGNVAGRTPDDAPVPSVVSLRIDRNEVHIRVQGAGGGSGARDGAGDAGRSGAGDLGGGTLPRFEIEVQLEGVVLEWQCPDRLVDLQRVREVGRTAARQARNRIEAAWSRAAALGVDPVGLGTALYRTDARTWRSLEGTWRRRLRDVKPDVRVTFHIRGYQLTASAP